MTIVVMGNKIRITVAWWHHFHETGVSPHILGVGWGARKVLGVVAEVDSSSHALPRHVRLRKRNLLSLFMGDTLHGADRREGRREGKWRGRVCLLQPKLSLTFSPLYVGFIIPFSFFIG